MKKTKVTHLTREFTEGINTLVGIQVETEEDKFVIPVVDVRISPEARKKAESIIKNNRAEQGSKFFRPSFSVLGRSYNVSQK